MFTHSTHFQFSSLSPTVANFLEIILSFLTFLSLPTTHKILVFTLKRKMTRLRFSLHYKINGRHFFSCALTIYRPTSIYHTLFSIEQRTKHNKNEASCCIIYLLFTRASWAADRVWLSWPADELNLRRGKERRKKQTVVYFCLPLFKRLALNYLLHFLIFICMRFMCVFYFHQGRRFAGIIYEHVSYIYASGKGRENYTPSWPSCTQNLSLLQLQATSNMF